MKVTYHSNNSGGGWWLKDKHWLALEHAGWTVKWFKDQKNESYVRLDDDGRWMGALATEAELECESMAEAITSFEDATGEDASAMGCNCCGAPHSFESEEPDPDGCDYVSGEDVLDVLYESRPQSLREAADRYGRRRR